MKDWVKLPTTWINEGGLKNFRWDRGQGSNNIAALMVLTVIAHHADSETGNASVTYDALGNATGLSRAKLSAGLSALEEQNIIERRIEQKRSTYKLIGMARSGWGMFPAKRLYSGDAIRFMGDLNLRKIVELNALKLWFLFIARRGTDTNAANISYDKIEEYTGISRDKIRSGISFLVTHGMVHVDHIPTDKSKYGVSNAYRIPYILPYKHFGTSAREQIEQFEDVPF